MWTEVAGPFDRQPVRFRLARRTSAPAVWTGRVEADIPIVGLCIARYRGELSWHKTTKRGAWSDNRPGLYAGLWISDLPRATLPGPVTVQLQLPGVATGWSVMAEPGTPIELLESVDTVTGAVVRILRVEGADPLEAGVLFLSRADVRSLRKGAWRLRAAVLAGVAEPWSRILDGPRHGRI